MLRIVYSLHAKEKLADRKISHTSIENALSNPDTIVDSIKGRQIAHKRINGRLLRVVFIKENNIYKIITAYFTKLERYIKRK